MHQKLFFLTCATLVWIGGIFAQKNAADAGPPLLLFDKNTLSAIGTSPTPTEYERKAAQLLQESVFKMTHLNAKIEANTRATILLTADSTLTKSRLGKNARFNFSNIKDGGFLVSADQSGLVVYGGGRKGVYYGVVDILQRFWGCDKLSPVAEIFRKHSRLSLPDTFYMDNPKNKIRIVNGQFSEKNPDFADWNRLDNHVDLFAKGYFVHTFHRLLPTETYFAAHPEYYCEMNGKRNTDQICLSHPEVLRLCIEKLKAEMALQPDATLWSVSQNDNYSYCQCAQCAKITEEEGAPSGLVIRFVNAVADAFPDKTISTLAYQFSRKAPLHVKPRKNVQVMLCSIELNRSQAIAEDPRSKGFVEDLKAWGGICQNIFLWDYGVDFMHYLMPFPNLHVLQPNIRLFTDHGTAAHFQQINTGTGHEMSELKYHLLSKLLWNPDANAEAVRADFISKYYGSAAAPYLLQYLQQLESEIQKTHEFLDIYGHPTAYKKTFLSAENMALYEKWFDKAMKGSKGAYLERVKVARLSPMYAQLEIGKSELFGPRGFFQKKKNDYRLNPAMKKVLDDFHAVCVKNGVQTLSEEGLSVENYYNTSKRALNFHNKNNLAFKQQVTASVPPSPKYAFGELQTLTDGVLGSGDFKSNWLGWQGESTSIVLDLAKVQKVDTIQVSSLYQPKSWILHPKSVTCSVSEDGKTFVPAGHSVVEGDQKNEAIVHKFTFPLPGVSCRYIKLDVAGTLTLFDWHPSPGRPSWLFLDEIMVKKGDYK
jgi:hypothetical protein